MPELAMIGVQAAPVSLLGYPHPTTPLLGPSPVSFAVGLGVSACIAKLGLLRLCYSLQTLQLILQLFNFLATLNAQVS